MTLYSVPAPVPLPWTAQHRKLARVHMGVSSGATWWGVTMGRGSEHELKEVAWASCKITYCSFNLPVSRYYLPVLL